MIITTEEPSPSAELSAPLEISIQTILQQGEFPLFSVHERGITISEELGEDQWTELIKAGLDAFSATKEAHVRVMFRVGDLLSFGEKKFGERYAQAIDATKDHLRLETKTLENIEWIARKVPAENRHENLSLAHHEAVARLEPKDQKKLLNLTEKEGWSVAALKDEVKEKFPGKRKLPSTKKTPPTSDKDAPSEDAALEGAETILRYFQSAEDPEKDGPLRTWGKQRLTKWNDAIHELEMIAKRVRVALKKA